MWHTILVALGCLICAILAIRSARLLYSALWLAGCSALTALLAYLLAAPEVAVIELSVGAGLVTVLFVFAINITGEDIPQAGQERSSNVPKLLAGVAVLAAAGLVAWMSLSSGEDCFVCQPPTGFSQFHDTLWQARSLDVLLQVVLIFCGVLGVLGLLDEAKSLIKEKGHDLND